jgi:hypothetical protein
VTGVLGGGRISQVHMRLYNSYGGLKVSKEKILVAFFRRHLDCIYEE